jgi:predicted nuclease of restriction endonuclease-like (RecB) superfamily
VLNKVKKMVLTNGSTIKDPYRSDFLGLGRESGEREIEYALVKHVTDFLLELGAGFAFVGRQVLLTCS